MADNELRRRRLKIIQVLLLVPDDLEDEKGRNRERIIWTRSWIRRREERGVYHQLIRELALEDEPAFARYFRMDKNKFDDLVGRIAIHIERQPTIMRTPISPGERLAVTLRYDLFSVLRGAFWDDVALKVSGGGVTRTNTNKIPATMLQVCRFLNRFQKPATCCRNKMLR